MSQHEKALSGHWEHFSHRADMGIRGVGQSVGEAFIQAALALTATITDPSGIRCEHSAIQIECEAADLDTLLFDWLNALVYEMAVRNMLFGRFQVHLRNRHLQARAWGEPVDRIRHQPAVEVKGATYTELRVAKERETWVAQCVIDV